MNSQSSLAPEETEDDIGLLDLLAVVAENLRLLILGPVLAGLVALGIMYAIPKAYESESWLRLGEADAPQFTSADVLLPLLEKAPWISASASSREDALTTLREQITASFSRKDGVVKLRVEAPTPEQARQLSLDLIDAYRAFNLPKGRNLERIQQEIELTKTSRDAMTTILQRVGENIDKVTPGTEGDNVARAYINLSEQVMARERTLIDLNRQLAGFGVEVFAQSPTTPEKPLNHRALMVTVVAWLASSMALLLFVFTREGWQRASQNAQDATKLARIRRSLSIRKSAP